MNRRQFFGMTAAAVAAAGLPLCLLPERKIFLPPRQKWVPVDIKVNLTYAPIPTWRPSTPYPMGSLVESNGLLFVCLQPGTSGCKPLEPTPLLIEDGTATFLAYRPSFV